MWAPVDNGADDKCLEILQQQSDIISRTNKLIISSSTTEFQENCIKKQLSAPAEHLRNKIYYNHLVTLKLQLFTSIYVKFGCKGPFYNGTTCTKKRPGV